MAAVTGGEQEHDAVFYPNGERDYYPNQQKPRREVMHPTGGGTLDLLCMNDDCNEVLLRTRGLKGINDGSLELTQIDTNIALVRDGITEKTLGYLAKNDVGHFVPAKTLEETQAAMHPVKDDTSTAPEPSGSATATAGNGTATALKTVGKVALGTLMVTALVAGALAEGMAEARANRQSTTPIYVAPPPTPTFTSCNRLGDSVNCTTY